MSTSMPRAGLAVSLYVAGRRVLVVGDGPIADERVQRLRAAAADVTVVAPGDFTPDQCAGAMLVLALDAASAAAVTAAARAHGALAYALDRPELSDLALPAIARRGALTIAVSTDGQAPALARRLREELERVFLESGAALDALLAELIRERAAASSAPGDDERKDRLRAIAARLRLTGRIEIKGTVPK